MVASLSMSGRHSVVRAAQSLLCSSATLPNTPLILSLGSSDLSCPRFIFIFRLFTIVYFCCVGCVGLMTWSRLMSRTFH